MLPLLCFWRCDNFGHAKLFGVLLHQDSKLYSQIPQLMQYVFIALFLTYKTAAEWQIPSCLCVEVAGTSVEGKLKVGTNVAGGLSPLQGLLSSCLL